MAHFLDRLIFCMFAEDEGSCRRVFSRILKKTNRDPRFVTRDISQLFEAMANGGDFYGERIPHFNGNLFDNTLPLELVGTEFPIRSRRALRLERDGPLDLRDPLRASHGPRPTLATWGALHRLSGHRHLGRTRHHGPLTSRVDRGLEKIAPLAPDVMEMGRGESLFRPAAQSSIQKAQKLIDAFLKRLRAIRVLDPACGSGNFLYVTLRMLKDLEKEILIDCRHKGLNEFALKVGPHQLLGIEMNPYAFDLAQMTVWIGFIQWQKDNGFPSSMSRYFSRFTTSRRKTQSST